LIVRGELWWASLDPIVGSEQGGRRPILGRIGVLPADLLHQVEYAVLFTLGVLQPLSNSK
jgi:hypothetical protein